MPKPRQRIITKMDIKIRCKDLPGLDLPKSDTMAVVSENRDNFGWNEVDRTDVITDTPNPRFKKVIKLEYHFEMAQMLKFDIYNVSTAPEAPVLIGSAEIKLSEILTKKKCQYLDDLSFEGKKGGRGRISVLVEENEETCGAIEFKVKGEDLDKKDLFGKSDPYIVLYRKTSDGKYSKVFKSEVIKKTLNPEWKKFKVRTWSLCGGDLNQEVKVECYDWDELTSDDLIGEGTFNLGKMLCSDGVQSVELINPELKKSKKKYKNSGKLIFESVAKSKIPTFIDFLNGDLEVNFMVAIDFTGSNGNYGDPNSLHYIDGPCENSYVKAIRSVGSILAAYDKDQKIPAYGFGAKFSNGTISHCFPLNGNAKNPEVSHISGVVDAYKGTLRSVSLWGPTYFNQIIKAASEIAKDEAKKKPYKYFVLLILTDGIIDDMPQTIDAIVEAANESPLSIVITGIGNADFGGMHVLDSDDRALVSSLGVAARRDIVQFVPFNNFANSPQMLAQETLAEIPRQVMTYMHMRGIEPVIVPTK